MSFGHTKQEELQVCFHCLEELKIKEERGQCARCGTLGVRGGMWYCFYWPQYFLRNYAAIPRGEMAPNHPSVKI